MQIKKQLLDYSAEWAVPDIYIFTGNPIIKANGAIVMGRGAAKQVRDSYPGIDQAFGRAVKDNPENSLLFVSVRPRSGKAEAKILGWFKVKNHWQQEARLDLIQESVYALTTQAVANPDVTFHMNYPGIGNGKLTEEEVNPLLTQLPNNVIIYQ